MGYRYCSNKAPESVAGDHVGIFYAAILHGVYDVFAGRFIGILIAGVTLMIFLYYLVHGGDETSSQASVQAGSAGDSTPADVSGK